MPLLDCLYVIYMLTQNRSVYGHNLPAKSYSCDHNAMFTAKKRMLSRKETRHFSYKCAFFDPNRDFI